MSYGLCDDDPYLTKEDAPPIPSSAPTLLLESKVELLLNKNPLDMDKDETNGEDDERIENRETYRQSRVSLNPTDTEVSEMKPQEYT